MSSAQQRLACTCIGAGCGAVSGGLCGFASLPYDICATLSWSVIFGVLAGGVGGAYTASRGYAALVGAVAGMIIAPIGIRVMLCLACP